MKDRSSFALWDLLSGLTDPVEKLDDSLLERCAATEQVIADIALQAEGAAREKFWTFAERWALFCAEVSRCVFWEPSRGTHLRSECSDLAKWTLRELEPDIPRTVDAYANIPECFSRDLLDLTDYSRFVEAELLKLQTTDKVLVLGIRTTGSHLAPIWHAALMRLGFIYSVTTVRPNRLPRGAVPATEGIDPEAFYPLPQEALKLTAFISEHIPERVRVYVVDDLAFSGMSYLRLEKYLVSLGYRADLITFVQDTSLVMSSLAPNARRSLLNRRVLIAPANNSVGNLRARSRSTAFFNQMLTRQINQSEVIDVWPMPLNVEQRYVAAMVNVPAAEVQHFEPRSVSRRHIVSVRDGDGQVSPRVAKVLGKGYFGARDFARIREFGDVGVPNPTLVEGFLFYDWIEGRSLEEDAGRGLDRFDLERLTEYVDRLMSLGSAGELSSEDYRNRILGQLPLPRLAARTLVAVPQRRTVTMWNVSRNQGAWHYLRALNGIRHVHLDLGEWSLKTSIAEEIAALAIELRLSETQIQFIVSHFSTTKTLKSELDQAAIRLGMVAYLSRALSHYDYWDKVVARIPTRFHRATDAPEVIAAQARRVWLGSELDRVLDSGGDLRSVR